MSELPRIEDATITFDTRHVFGPRVIRTLAVACLVFASCSEAVLGASAPPGMHFGPRRYERGIGPRPRSATITDAHGAFALRLLELQPDERRRFAELGGVRATIAPVPLGLPLERSHSLELTYGLAPTLPHTPWTMWEQTERRFEVDNPTPNAVSEIALVVIVDGVSFAQRCAQLLVSNPADLVLPRESWGHGHTRGGCHRPRVPESIAPGDGAATMYIHRVLFSDGTELLAD